MTQSSAIIDLGNFIAAAMSAINGFSGVIEELTKPSKLF